VEEKKEYTAKEVAEGILARAKELAEHHLRKAEMSAKEADKESKMDKADPRNQTTAQMAEIKVPQPKAPAGQPKAIAKQPLQLKKFLEKCQAKKLAKKNG
jgi:hypothetical protein